PELDVSDHRWIVHAGRWWDWTADFCLGLYPRAVAADYDPAGRRISDLPGRVRAPRAADIGDPLQHRITLLGAVDRVRCLWRGRLSDGHESWVQHSQRRADAGVAESAADDANCRGLDSRSP